MGNLERKKKFGRRRHRLKDDIKIDLKWGWMV
jgi:hypothetical protein